MKKPEPPAVLLRRLCRGRSNGELKPVFALIRAQTDAKLLAGINPPKRKAKKARKGDKLVMKLQELMRPIMAPAAEKAELLVEHMAKAHNAKLDFEPRGLADAVKRLRAQFTDAQIRSGARALVRELEALYSKRETVV